MRISEAEQILYKKVFEYSKKLDADVEYSSGKKTADFSIPLKRCDIIFKLTRKEKVAIPAGTLYCQISVGKTGQEKYMLHEVINVLNPDDFRATIFTYLYKEERIEKAFSFLTEILDRYMSEIKDILTNENARKTLCENRVTDIKKVYKLSEEQFGRVCENDNMDFYHESIEMVQVQRLTNYIAYNNYLRCRYNKSIKIYGKLIAKGREMIYEKSLYEYMEDDEKIKIYPLPKGFDILTSYDETPLDLLKLMILPFVFWSVVMLCICMVTTWVWNRGTVYAVGMEWFLVFPFALLPAMFTGFAFRRRIYQIAGNKDKYEQDLLIDSKGENKFINITALIVILVSLTAMINISIMGARFYDYYFIADESEKLLGHDWQTYYYKDIDKVYYIEGRYNDYGEYIDRASYVLIFNDGREVDTDMWSSLDEMKNTVFPIMKIENKKIIRVHSEKDIKE